MAETQWVLRNAAIDDSGLLVDIALEKGLIKAMGAKLPLQGKEEWNLEGKVVMPAFVDAHVHLDKTLTLSFNKSGTLTEAEDIWRREKSRQSYEGYLGRAVQAMHLALSKGTTAMRTHVDADNVTALEAVLTLKERHQDLMALQIVAQGKAGASPDNDAAMRKALDLGADIIGGAPSQELEPKRAIDAILDLAEKYQKPVDLHIDESDVPDISSLDYLTSKVLERGLRGLVTAGHCSALSFVDHATADQVMDKMQAAGIAVITMPSSNLILIGRGITPQPRGLTRVKELLGRGINVVAATDHVANAFNPLGNYDLLQTANLTAQTAQMTGTRELGTCLNMVSTRAAEVLGLKDYGLYEGASADLVVINARSPQAALATVPERLATFRRGGAVVRSDLRRIWAENLVKA